MSRQLRPRGSNRIRYDNKAGPYGINHLSQASQPEGPAYQENRPPGDAVEVTSGNVSDSTFNEAEDIASIESEGVSEGEMAKAKERLEYMGDEYFAGSDAEDDLSSDVDELQSEDGYIGVPAKRMAKGGPRNAKDTAKVSRLPRRVRQDFTPSTPNRRSDRLLVNIRIRLSGSKRSSPASQSSSTLSLKTYPSRNRHPYAGRSLSPIRATEEQFLSSRSNPTTTSPKGPKLARGRLKKQQLERLDRLEMKRYFRF